LIEREPLAMTVTFTPSTAAPKTYTGNPLTWPGGLYACSTGSGQVLVDRITDSAILFEKGKISRVYNQETSPGNLSLLHLTYVPVAGTLAITCP
jgi:hypothetical protein